MNPRAPDSPVLRNFALAGLILGSLLALAWWKCEIVPFHRSCKVCAAERYHKTIYLYGHPLGSWDTEATPGEATRNYFDRYLGYSHAHEWQIASGGYDRTHMGLQLVAASGLPEPEQRRLYFESIIRPTDIGHAFRVLETWQYIDNQIIERHPEESGSDADPVWSPEMEGIKIPDEVKGGTLLPDPDAPPLRFKG